MHDPALDVQQPRVIMSTYDDRMEVLGAIAAAQNDVQPRLIHVSWNGGLVAASVAISLLGAFTSTQLMCQAKVSRSTVAVTTWTALASLTFGFCSIWSLHMVAMLACELDLPIELNASLTILSALLAVIFTFLAFADVIWERYGSAQYPKLRRRPSVVSISRSSLSTARESEEFLLSTRSSFEEPDMSTPMLVGSVDTSTSKIRGPWARSRPSPLGLSTAPEMLLNIASGYHGAAEMVQTTTEVRETSISIMNPVRPPLLRRTSSQTDSDTTFSGMGGFIGIRQDAVMPFAVGNPFKTIAMGIWTGLTWRNLGKGFVWSLAITCMHYLGIYSIVIPNATLTLNPFLVILSAIISWMVCSVGCILMPSLENNMGQQLLFSIVASLGVAAMHYTGMAALNLYSTSQPSERRGYPPGLPVAIASIAILTCLAANALLAHSATLARNKLVEIVRTKKRLWAAIAQKENAEAAALARSEFIASASHEIRTPLHQLQGYSDLMARCTLPDEARLLLFAIQDATKTLSLITNNVLDWSRLEKGEAVTRITSIDVRSACESIIKLLPRRDEDATVVLIAVVSPDVPRTILFDETYLQRIVMNLVSNALKFTSTGYVSVHIDRGDGCIVITVRDTGIGIPESFLPHLFEPFKQAQTRGAEHGTGLGLSIVKQLLEKVQGQIQVKSSHADAHGVGPTGCGSQFTVTIPIDIVTDGQEILDISPGLGRRKKLAFFGHESRTFDGLVKAWSKYKTDVVCVEQLEDITAECDYLWLDIEMFKLHMSLLQRISAQSNLKILVTCDDQMAMDKFLGHKRSSHIIVVRKPWVFHQIIQAISSSDDTESRPGNITRTVRFASTDEIVPDTCDPRKQSTPSVSSSETLVADTPLTDIDQATAWTVLLVEDNKINQRLGAKMLQTLGYDVMLASDGQEAVDMLQDPANASLIDIVLMDQSMPRKDGLTATKEIRELEENGEIAGALRWRDNSTRRSRRPILAVTAVVGPSHEAMCKAVGTDAFLAKPLKLSKLKEALAEYE